MKELREDYEQREKAQVEQIDLILEQHKVQLQKLKKQHADYVKKLRVDKETRELEHSQKLNDQICLKNQEIQAVRDQVQDRQSQLREEMEELKASHQQQLTDLKNCHLKEKEQIEFNQNQKFKELSDSHQ